MIDSLSPTAFMTPMTATPQDDAACIARSVAEPSAFRVVFTRHHDRVHRYVASRTGPDAAHDIVSETFLQAFRHRHRFDASTGVDALPWLLGIATKLIARARGAEARWHRRRIAAMQLARDPASGVAAPEASAALDRIDAQQMRPELLAALGRLRRDERDALCACVLGGLTYEQAAASLGVPIGTIRSRVARARERLRHSLDPS
jgi:RNA polymerase sigma factor (sigma-70 family)